MTVNNPPLTLDVTLHPNFNLRHLMRTALRRNPNMHPS